MIIQVDQEGRNVITQLCDIALKQGGVQNLNAVNAIFKSVVVLPTPEDIEQGQNPPKSPEKKDETAGQTDAEKQEEKPKEEVEEEVVEDKPEPVKEQ